MSCYTSLRLMCPHCHRTGWRRTEIGRYGKVLHKGALYCTAGKTDLLLQKGHKVMDTPPEWCPIKPPDPETFDGNLHCKLNKSCRSSNGPELCCWVCNDRSSCEEVCHNAPSRCGQSFTREATK